MVLPADVESDDGLIIVLQIVGVALPRLTGMLKSVNKVQAVLRKTVVGQQVYLVLTAFSSHL